MIDLQSIAVRSSLWLGILFSSVGGSGCAVETKPALTVDSVSKAEFNAFAEKVDQHFKNQTNTQQGIFNSVQNLDSDPVVNRMMVGGLLVMLIGLTYPVGKGIWLLFTRVVKRNGKIRTQ